MITHYDLFAGIGGFSLALEEVFVDEPIRHIFCEWESFPTAVLRQHWPDGEYWGDIADLVAHTDSRRRNTQSRPSTVSTKGRNDDNAQSSDFTIVTGGFPCQPFSHAGRRKGTADDRYQWPNMFAVIRHTKPEWVIAENVRGLITWNEGLVLETVCSDLESEGYEVQPFIIPAVAVGAPHRRDRVWIIGHLSNAKHNGRNGTQNTEGSRTGDDSNTQRQEQIREPKGANPVWFETTSWSQNWMDVAAQLCSVDDGLSNGLGKGKQIKAYGNAIVPQVAMEIMKAIEDSL